LKEPYIYRRSVVYSKYRFYIKQHHWENRHKQLYVPVKDEIWMPVTHKFEIEASIFGLKAEIGYSSSIKYLDVTPNELLHKPETVTANYHPANFASAASEVPVSKNQQKIQEILNKGEMKNADMIKLAKLMEKESKRVCLTV